MSATADTSYLFEGTSAAAPTQILTAISSSAVSELTLGGLTNGTNSLLLPGPPSFPSTPDREAA